MVWRESWNRGMIWDGREFKPHPVPHPAMGRNTFHRSRWLHGPSSLALETSRVRQCGINDIDPVFGWCKFKFF